jgi:hypothetical protein
MLTSLQNLDTAITELKDIIGSNFVEIDDVLIRLEKFIRTVFAGDSKDKKGDELMVPLDAVFSIAIDLFRMIDTGNTGLDDKMVEELTKIKTKYLGV